MLVVECAPPIFVADNGGTNLRTGQLRSGELTYRTVDRPGSLRELLRVLGSQVLEWANCDSMASDEAPQTSLAVNGPARMLPDGTALVGPLYGFNTEEFNLTRALNEATPGLEERGVTIHAVNDGTAAALTAPIVLERLDACVDDSQIITYLNIGTGIGGDTILKDDYSGGEYRSVSPRPEYGEMMLMCGGVGAKKVSWGQLASGEAIRNRYGGDQKRNACDLYVDPTVGPEVWQAIGEDIATGLGSLVPALGSDVVLIGGGVSCAHPKFEVPLREALSSAIGDLPEGSATRMPDIYYVPGDWVQIMGLYGAGLALQARNRQRQALPVPVLVA